MLTVSIQILGEWHVVRYQRGDEGRAMREIEKMIRRRILDWFEGAILIEQIRKAMALELVTK